MRNLVFLNSACQPVAVGVLTPDAPPDHLRREAVGHDDKNFAHMPCRTLNRLDGIPRVVTQSEEKTAIHQHLGGAGFAQVRIVRSRMTWPFAPVVQHQGLPAPGLIPVVWGIEIEDMRTELAPGVSVRRNGPAGRGVMPVLPPPSPSITSTASSSPSTSTGRRSMAGANRRRNWISAPGSTPISYRAGSSSPASSPSLPWWSPCW